MLAKSIPLILDQVKERYIELLDKIQAFEKWLRLDTPYENAGFEKEYIRKEFCKTFGIDVDEKREKE